MKKVLAFLLILSSFATLNAQNIITNGDFETWSYGKAVGWTAGLHGYITSFVNIPVEVNFGSQTTDSHNGNYAIKLESADFTIPNLGYTIPLPGILQVGESEGFSIPLEDIMAIIQAIQDTTGTGFDPDNLSSLTSLAKIFAPGIPCTQTPGAVTMWVKYQPVDEDEMLVLAMTKQNGTPVSYAYNTYGSLNPDGYQQIALNFDDPGTACDSIMIVIISSTSMGGGSILYVDDVKLMQEVAVPVVETERETVYPNPASDVLYFQANTDKQYQWSLRDLTGRTLDSGKSVGKTSLDVKKYPAGVYMLTFNVNGSEKTRKVVIR